MKRLQKWFIVGLTAIVLGGGTLALGLGGVIDFTGDGSFEETIPQPRSGEITLEQFIAQWYTGEKYGCFPFSVAIQQPGWGDELLDPATQSIFIADTTHFYGLWIWAKYDGCSDFYIAGTIQDSMSHMFVTAQSIHQIMDTVVSEKDGTTTGVWTDGQDIEWSYRIDNVPVQPLEDGSIKGIPVYLHRLTPDE